MARFQPLAGIKFLMKLDKLQLEKKRKKEYFRILTSSKSPLTST